MSRISTKQRHDGYIQLQKDIGTDANLRSFLEGICYAEEVLSTPEPTQDEPVDISAKSGPTIAAVLPNGVAVSNVYEAYEAGMKEGSLQDEEPVAYLYDLDAYCDHRPEQDVLARKIPKGIPSEYLNNVRPLYLHPTPRPEFVRLSEEDKRKLHEEFGLWTSSIRAVEDALEEKNTSNKSDPDSVDLQSRCRGDKL